MGTVPDRYVLALLGNFRKLSTKNTSKLENSSYRYGFFGKYES